jgi:energy-coupling factor transporter ATP-binding protein EcfA2
MEMKDLLNKYNIIGVISNYKHHLDLNNKVKDLNVNNLDNALKMVSLDNIDINKELKDLSISELWKIDLMTKLNSEIIIIGNMSNSLNYKDRELMKKLFIKLSRNYNKKIVIIDENVELFFDLVKRIVVLNNKKVIYETSDFFDLELYKYTNIPKIIDFITYINSDKRRLNQTTDIYELIKDIYRSVS